MNLLLTTGITELGVRASNAALTVFESKLSYGDNVALQMICSVLYKCLIISLKLL